MVPNVPQSDLKQAIRVIDPDSLIAGVSMFQVIPSASPPQMQSAVADSPISLLLLGELDRLEASVAGDDRLEASVTGDDRLEASVTGDDRLEASVTGDDRLEASVTGDDRLEASVTGDDRLEASVADWRLTSHLSLLTSHSPPRDGLSVPPGTVSPRKTLRKTPDFPAGGTFSQI